MYGAEGKSAQLAAQLGVTTVSDRWPPRPVVPASNPEMPMLPPFPVPFPAPEPNRWRPFR